MKPKSLFSLAAVVILSGCSWVKLIPGADQVDVLDASGVSACERIGATTAKSMDKFAFVDRNRDKVAEELATLARNEAEAMGGNALVAETEIMEGSQRFGVYRCP